MRKITCHPIIIIPLFDQEKFMKIPQIIIIIILFSTGVILSAENSVFSDSFQDNIKKRLQICLGYSGQYNSSIEYHSPVLARIKYDLESTPFSIESNVLNLTFIDMGHKRHYSLNTWLYPAALLTEGATSIIADSLAEKQVRKNWIYKTITAPLVLGAIANAATNLEVQYALDKKRNFSIFCGTTGDLYRINKAERFRYTFTTGISLFRPINLKIFYTKDINKFMGIKDREMIGVSLMYIVRTDNIKE